METTDTVFDKYTKQIRSQDIIGGLSIAQAICSRKLIESFDNKCHNVVLSIMQEIVETIDNVMEENNG